MLVRSWNLFHGNTLPPGRRSHLEEMIRLATDDRPDVLCLQEVPLWSLSRLPRLERDDVRHVVTRNGPLGAWLGGVITRLNNGFFRSRLAGQANAILLAPGLEADRAPLAQDRRAPPRAALLPRRHARRARGREPSRHERHPPAGGPGREIVRAEAFVTAIAGGLPCVLAGDFNLRAQHMRELQRLVGARARVSTTCSCAGSRPRRSASGRSSDGAEWRRALGSRSGGGDGRMTPAEARALFPVLERARVSERRHLRADRPRRRSTPCGTAAGRPGARPLREAVLRAGARSCEPTCARRSPRSSASSRSTCR